MHCSKTGQRLRLDYFTSEVDDSIDQNINGFFNPVRYSWSPNPDLGVVTLLQIKFVLIDTNVTNFIGNYASRATLLRGVEFGFTYEDTDYAFVTVKENRDFALFTTEGTSTTFNQQGNTTQTGVSLLIKPPVETMYVDYKTSFFIDIRDDLTSIASQRAIVQYQSWR